MSMTKGWVAALLMASASFAGDLRAGRWEKYTYDYALEGYWRTYNLMLERPSDLNAKAAFDELNLAYGNIYYCWFPWWYLWLDGSMTQTYWLSRWTLGRDHAATAYQKALATYNSNPTTSAYNALFYVTYAWNASQSALNQGAPGDGLSADLRTLRDAINANRAANGLARLPVDGQLCDACVGHASWMAANNSAAHVEGNGSTPGSRATAQGIVDRVIETDLAGVADAAAAFAAIAASTQETAPLRHPKWSILGLARNGSRVCVNYADRRDLSGRPAPSTAFANHGGPVMGKVKVVPIFVGAYWASGAPAVNNQIGYLYGSLQTIVASSFADNLLEYSTPSTTIGRGTVTGNYTISDVTPGPTVSRATLEGYLANVMPSLPAPDGNTLYTLILPSGTTGYVGGQEAGASGFHNYITLGNGMRAYYANVLFGGPDFMTSVLSHEVAEAITDPDVATGWFNASGFELADTLYEYAAVGGYLMQKIWSNVNSDYRVAP